MNCKLLRSIAGAFLIVAVPIGGWVIWAGAPRSRETDTAEADVEAPTPQPISPTTTSGLRMAIGILASDDGGRLEAGTEGWVSFWLTNTTKKPVWLPIVQFRGGKGDPDRSPSIGPVDYSGFGLAKIYYSFVPQGAGKPTESQGGLLGAPDAPLILAPKESREFWRRIRAPLRPGRYVLVLHLENTSVILAAATPNNPPPAAGRKPVELECRSLPFFVPRVKEIWPLQEPAARGEGLLPTEFPGLPGFPQLPARERHP